MVAYSCQKQFAPDIQSGVKTHTIRGQRKRHARVGEQLQLYSGMRTKHCFKIMPDPVCTFVEPIWITLAEGEIIMIWIGHGQADEILRRDFDRFARLDGFADENAMAEFWDDNKTQAIEGTYARQFEGWIIGWGKHPLEVLYG
mgnify:CR=1 FL=1